MKRRSRNLIWKLRWQLKKIWIIIFLVALGAITPWFLFISFCSPLQLQAYQNFLCFGFGVFSISCTCGLALGIPPKKSPSKVIIPGGIRIEEGVEWTIRTHSPKYQYVSKKTIKYILICSGILSFLGFGYGIVSFSFGYVCIALGGFLLGVGVIFSFKPLRRYY